MDASDGHLRQARHNADIYQELTAKDESRNDWAVTVLFYAAVHVADAFLASCAPPIQATSHLNRRQRLAEASSIQAAASLGLLWSASEDARYCCARFSRQEVEHYETVALRDLPRALGFADMDETH